MKLHRMLSATALPSKTSSCAVVCDSPHCCVAAAATLTPFTGPCCPRSAVFNSVMSKVVVVGGGLSGLSAAHTVLERGGRVIVLDKNSFLGGNSTKATSGINGAGTKQQRALGINDSAETFAADTSKSANKGQDGVPISALGRVLTYDSGPAVEWLTDSFGLDLSLVSRLGGHSQPRTHRGKERFPGMTITYALMEKLEEIAKQTPERAQIVTGAKVVSLVTDQKTGAVIGANYEMRDGKTGTEYGPVVIATGGYAADFSADSLLRKYRPDLLDMGLPTTNGEHCTGDGIKFAQAVGAAGKDLEHVQVHPTGLVHPEEPDAKVKFLAAEALRGVGGLLLNKEGDRFCNELGTRDYVTGCMWSNAKGPYRLILNSKCGKEIEWHCKHYTGRGLMKHYANAAALAKDMGISEDKLATVYEQYNEGAKANNDVHGRKYFQNMPWTTDDSCWVAIVCPVLHYCMGGLEITPQSECVSTGGKVIPGLYCCGEAAGGIHGKNRLGGSSLLDCVVFGRVAGANVSKYLLDQLLANPTAAAGAAAGAGAVTAAKTGIGATITSGGVVTSINVDPSAKKVTMELAWGDAKTAVSTAGNTTTVAAAPAAAAAAPAPAAAAAPKAEAAPAAAAAPAAPARKEYTLEEVAQHNKEKDCWVVVNGEVLDVTGFMKDHPGGKQAILLFAGKDATAEFNMLHKPDVVAKYAPNSIIGTLKGASQTAAAHGTAGKVTKIASHL